MTAPANTPKGLAVEDIVTCLRDFMSENGHAPTVQELGDCLGLASKSSVAYWLKKAEQEGLIERVVRGNHTKAIRIRE